jgi:sirohydrochlorin ferrochelatase
MFALCATGPCACGGADYLGAMKDDPAPAALIVSHGQPSDPAPAAADLARLAAAVAVHLPGWRVGSATLAEADALSCATTGPQGLIYPMFMAAGWFTRTHLPQRLADVGAGGWRVLDPFGTDPRVQALALALVREAGLEAGGDLLLAAHGSFRSAAPGDVARQVAGDIGAALGLARAQAAFIDQTPRLAGATGFGPDALCLPFFAASGGHVIDDLPAALAEAGFQGRVLQPLGLDVRAPALIAASLKAAAGL